MDARTSLLIKQVRRSVGGVKKAAATLALARLGRSIGGDVCLGVDECDQLIKDLREAEAELNEVLERMGG